MPAITRCVHTIPGGYYLQWELLDQVYRKAFMFSTYQDNPKRALKAAIAERDWLDKHRDLIYRKLGKILLAEGKVIEAGKGQYKVVRTKRGKVEGKPEQPKPTKPEKQNKRPKQLPLQLEPLQLEGIASVPPDESATQLASPRESNIAALARRVQQARIEKQKRAESKKSKSGRGAS